MTLTRDHSIVFECDKCHGTLRTSTSEFGEAMSQLRRAHWKSIPRLNPHSPEWDHHCADCKVEQRRMV